MDWDHTVWDGLSAYSVALQLQIRILPELDFKKLSLESQSYALMEPEPEWTFGFLVEKVLISVSGEESVRRTPKVQGLAKIFFSFSLR